MFISSLSPRQIEQKHFLCVSFSGSSYQDRMPHLSFFPFIGQPGVGLDWLSVYKLVKQRAVSAALANPPVYKTHKYKAQQRKG